MKKIIPLLLVGLITGMLPVQAQLSFGGRAGLTAYRLTEEASFTKTNVELGVLFGGFVRLGDNLFIQPELNYVRKATKVTTSGVVYADNPTEKLGFTSLQLPVMAGYKLFRTDDGTSSLRLMAGPVFDLLLKTDDNEFDLQTKDFHTATLSVEAGVGLDLWFLTFDLRYGYGLSQVLEEQADVRSRMVTLSAGIKL